MFHIRHWIIVCSFVAAVAMFGCNQSSKNKSAVPPESQVSSQEHGEWWCDEHGVPEEICAQCNTKLVADFKAKGDWCEKHNRPDSQCFICHPEKEKEFAALYEAKYGKLPPKPSADTDEQSGEQKSD